MYFKNYEIDSFIVLKMHFSSLVSPIFIVKYFRKSLLIGIIVIIRKRDNASTIGPLSRNLVASKAWFTSTTLVS